MHWREFFFPRLIWHASRWNKFLKMKWRKERKREEWKKTPRMLHILLHLFEILGTFDDTRSKWVPWKKKASNHFHFFDRVLVNIMSIITASLVQHILGLLCLIYVSFIERSVIQIPSYRLTTTMSTGSETARIVIMDLKWSKLFTSLVYFSEFSSESCLCWLKTQSCLIDLDAQLPLILWGAGDSNSFLKSQFFCLSWLGL